MWGKAAAGNSGIRIQEAQSNTHHSKEKAEKKVHEIGEPKNLL